MDMLSKEGFVNGAFTDCGCVDARPYIECIFAVLSGFVPFEVLSSVRDVSFI